MRRRALLGTTAAGIAGAAGCLSVPGPDEPLGVPVSETPWGDGWRTEGVDRVVVDSGPAERTGITASRETLTLPSATATFTLRNRRAGLLKTNPDGWTLWRHEGDGWRGVYPDGYLQSQTTLLPGQSLVWDVRIDNRGAERGAVAADTEGEVTTFEGVRPGRYAVSNKIAFGDQWVLAVSEFHVVEE